MQGPGRHFGSKPFQGAAGVRVEMHGVCEAAVGPEASDVREIERVEIAPLGGESNGFLIGWPELFDGFCQHRFEFSGPRQSKVRRPAFS